jgi:hypothetical protein
MKIKISLVILLMTYQLISFSQLEVITLKDFNEVEYEIPGDCEWNWEAEFADVWKVTGLTHNKIYTMIFSMPTIFDELVYASRYYYNWTVLNDDYPNSQTWKWIGPNNGIDYFHLECYEHYSEVELNAVEVYSLGLILLDPYQNTWDAASFKIVTSMEISGPSLDCNNPVQYSLLNLATGGSSSWTIKQNGITKASGNGTTATANNISTGNFEVKFAVSFQCGLNTIYFAENNWFGVPIPTIDGYQYPECGDRYWYFLDPEDRWGTYYWNVTYGLTIIGSRIGTKALIQADEEGNHGIYCDVTNSCGTGYGGLMVIVDCYGFKISPNPADDYVEISLDENKIDLNNINEYEIRIYNNQQILVNQTKTTKPSVKINTSKLPDGLYIINLLYNDKTSSEQVIIEH